MKVLIVLIIAHLALSHSAQKPSSSSERNQAKDQSSSSSSQDGLMKVQALLQDKLRNARSNFRINSSAKKANLDDLKSSSRKPKSLAFFPFFPPPPPPPIPLGVPQPGYFFQQNKEIPENSYPTEWLSRTEPFKKNPPLLDSPTYYIRLPPNPYMYIPGIGYVSRPPAFQSDPEVLENEKHHQSNEVENDVHDSFYKVPVKFISNGKPISVYQLPNGQTIPRPESSLINLSKGPYLFNGKPNEIYLVAQIYDALYGDELSHFYP